ncbi:CRAL/TRIO domain-containing protein [Basidiobolus meristosporus CBS 931.73]|uniref:CRAL/TRIO domain-containing protein n=1 Tax=Basidiobolus meristosporus CBS 931.73 TaxID=1314790 RepID=A0A1Y1XZE7_9FUNG|nr:CRAL/TRIO domain-containing protein [Basidiobolus meristosporus CBS 931.73]|eukprot:ORX90866.1 CRAL/TRIO domain-containing protein [Basidiobolus meristosporus CBS 931.73]
MQCQETGKASIHSGLTAEQLKSLQLIWLELLPKLREHPHNQNQSAEDSGLSSVEKAFWKIVLFDHPDSILLRFLRARKFDVSKSCEMLLNALDWRLEEDVESIIEKGETVLNQRLLQDGLTHFHGRDPHGRPIAYVHHWHPKAQSLQELKQYVIWTLETGRLLLDDDKDGKVSAIIDTSGFNMSKVDFSAANFLVSCMEAYYPECLGNLYIVEAPWVFSGFWKMISPLLDPVIKSKIIFCKRKELSNYLEPEQLMEAFGGKDPYKYHYIPPSAEELGTSVSSKEKSQAHEAFWEAGKAFAHVTEKWANNPAKYDQERQDAARDLRKAGLKLQPFIRAPTFYHRIGAIHEKSAL